MGQAPLRDRYLRGLIKCVDAKGLHHQRDCSRHAPRDEPSPKALRAYCALVRDVAPLVAVTLRVTSPVSKRWGVGAGRRGVWPGLVTRSVTATRGATSGTGAKPSAFRLVTRSVTATRGATTNTPEPSPRRVQAGLVTRSVTAP